MNYENLTFQQLRSKCYQIGLKPCTGKGVDRKFLLNLIDTATSTEEELKIREYDPDFYESIKPFVSSMPDFRPSKTMAQMIQEPQNNWRLILHELEALGYDEEAGKLLDIINRGDRKTVEEYIRFRKDLIEDFVFSFPAITWLLMKTGDEDVIYPLLISVGMYLEEIPMKREYISFIKDEEIARIIFSSYSSLLPPGLAWPKEIIADRFPDGYLYWFYVAFPKRFYDRIGDFIEWSLISPYREDVIFVLKKGKDVINGGHLFHALERLLNKWEEIYQQNGRPFWMRAPYHIRKM